MQRQPGQRVLFAGVAELVDALDLGSSAARRGGSSPLIRTMFVALPRFALLERGVFRATALHAT